MLNQKNQTVVKIIIIVSIVMLLYHMVYSIHIIQTSMLHYFTHLCFSLLVCFLVLLQQSKTRQTRIFNILSLIIVIIAFFYVQFYFQDIQNRAWFNTFTDLAIGFILILLVLVATSKAYGRFMPLLALIVVAYPFIGVYLPEPFYTTSLGLARTIGRHSMDFDAGLFGTPLQVSASYLCLFVFFGSLLSVTGATKLFFYLARMFASRYRGGAGLMAIISSAGVGSITGSVAANIAITGAFTIPAMKKVGYSPEEAAAIEAAASNGGQILPPVMGLVAFGMAGLTGIPYIIVCKMALIPALLYFLVVTIYVDTQARKKNILPLPREKIDIKDFLHALFLFVVPISVVLILLLLRYSVMKTAFGAIISTFMASLIRKETRPSLTQFIEGIAEGAKNAANVAVMCACIGIIATTFIQTGIGVKLSSGIELWSGGNLFIALLIIFSVSIILGMAGASLSAYIMVAVFAAPALINLGIPIHQAHFFVMFPALFAYITPPVAFAALVASRLAGSSYIETSIETLKAGMAGLLLPFMIIYVPILLLEPQPVFEAILGISACIIIFISLQYSAIGFFIVKLDMFERILWFLSSVLLFTYLILQVQMLFILGTVLFLILISFHINKASKTTILKTPISRQK